MAAKLKSPEALPYGHPNQPYDKLPGTLETYHVDWARPLPGGKLRVLFIIPYLNSREVVETAQRLDLKYTVIMNAGVALWGRGKYEGINASPLHGPDGEEVVEKLSQARLALSRTYDAMVIGKVSWEVIPKPIRKLILAHVKRGTGLVYVSPNRIEEGDQTTREAPANDAEFDALFRASKDPAIARSILDALPLDLLPFKVLPAHRKDRELSYFRSDDKEYLPQIPLSVTVSSHGKGRVVALDYHDSNWRRGLPCSLPDSLSPEMCHYPKLPIGSHHSLSPELAFDKVVYDHAFALLARCICVSARRHPSAHITAAFDVPATGLKPSPVKNPYIKFNTPDVLIAREDLDNAKVTVGIEPLSKSAKPAKLECVIRNAEGQAVQEDRFDITATLRKTTVTEIDLPALPRGNYTLGLRVLDPRGNVLEFASRSFRVESGLRVVRIETDKDAYGKDETIRGKAVFSKSLTPATRACVWASDTWGRTICKVPINLGADKTSGTFSLPVKTPLSRLWDIHCQISDAKGAIDSGIKWVGLPDWDFDEYIWALIFSPHPELDWKGRLYADVIRPYGVNANNTYLIATDAKLYEYELCERHHLYSISYADNWGPDIGVLSVQYEKRQQAIERLLGQPRLNIQSDTECSECCPAEFSRMARHIADTGKMLDPKEFPYKSGFGVWVLDAERINARIKAYLESGKFGSPYYWLCGEVYLWGEFVGKENSCFCPLCTKNFQEWCRGQYGNDLSALNAEWNTAFSCWDEVRGILFKEAKGKKQLPRWVDFRFFMRSRVWTQFFLDWAEMINRFVPEAKTGYNGHDHYDLSRFRKQMTSGKMYMTPESGLDVEWRTCVLEELHQSFSGDQSFLVAANSMIRWNPTFETARARRNWPWQVLFAGYRGFDWEEGLSFQTLGGDHCFTPDFSEPLPYFRDISREVLYLQRGIGKLAITAKPHRSPVAILWAPCNHYISRLHPFQEDGFTGTYLANIVVDGGAIADSLVMMKSLRIRPTFLAPEDLAAGALKERGFKALLLPYSKGMSQSDATAIREFVAGGGLVIADNTPGIYTEHGRELAQPRLADLFPATGTPHILRFGKGFAAYLPNGFNHYLARLETGDYAQADSVALLLEKYAGVDSPVELIDRNGNSRRDTLTAIYLKGSAMYVGMLRNPFTEGKEPEETTVKLQRKYHVWDVRKGKYCGFGDSFKFNLDMRPKFIALLPANPKGIRLCLRKSTVDQGENLDLAGTIRFEGGQAREIAGIGQVVHVEVFGPDGKELECFRSNRLFAGKNFELALPISYSEKPGKYTVKVEYPITGAKSEIPFTVK